MTDNKISVEATVRNIQRKTRRKYTAEEKIRIVLEGLRGEETITELCRKEGINSNLYYKWSKEFLEARKAKLSGNTKQHKLVSEYIDKLLIRNERLIWS
jgi:transposase